MFNRKQVERAAEGCAAAMAGVLPVDLVVRVLNPIIKTGDFPVNQAAIKMLTKVAEKETSREVVSQHLEEIMPGLLKVSPKNILRNIKKNIKHTSSPSEKKIRSILTTN